jgi:hypothetical protein
LFPIADLTVLDFNPVFMIEATLMAYQNLFIAGIVVLLNPDINIYHPCQQGAFSRGHFKGYSS